MKPTPVTKIYAYFYNQFLLTKVETMSAPSAPIITLAPRSSSQTLEFQWSPPASGSPITGYEIDVIGSGGGTFTTTGTYYKITGLTNGTLYTATVRAQNSNGYGPTASFRPFEPGNGVPLAPATATAVAGAGYTSAVVSWTAPSSLPDSTIYWYVITSPEDANIKRTANGLTQSSLLITGLNPASNYTFNVRAANCPGYGPATTTNSVGPPTKGSAVFDTVSYYTMSPGISFGNNDYTLEFWFKLPIMTSGNFFTMPIFGPTAPGGLGCDLLYRTDFSLYQITINQLAGGSSSGFSLPVNLIQDTWYYVAVVRSATVGTLWLGATPGGSASRSGSGTIADSRNYTGITNLLGRDDGFGQAINTLQVTNVRIINGSALYNPTNTTITIPSAPLTDVTNTELLYLASSAGNLTTDTSGTQTLTATGTPTWSSSTPYP